ncbi:MAG: hypothetical protein ACLQEQ_09820 [Nitrososphaerales archaeon]
MKTGPGMWVMILGILGIIIGGAMYGDNYHKTIGTGGIVLGVILIILGAAWWMMTNRKAPMAAVPPQPAQPAKTP